MAPTLAQTAFFLLLGCLVSAKGALHARALTPAGSANLPTKWSYYGCYLDTGNPHTLASATYTNATSMTDEACVTFCKGNSYIFAGLERSQECYCGNYFTTNVTEPDTNCSMACTGNATEPCGGPNRLSIFWSGDKPPPPPITNPGPPGWIFQGCYTEGTGGHALSTGVAVTGGSTQMTVAACTTACQGAGFIYAGTENANQCYCGNSITNGGALDTNQGDCNLPCAGNSSEYCGAANLLDVYELASAISSASSSSSSSASSAQPTSVSPTQSSVSSTKSSVSSSVISTPSIVSSTSIRSSTVSQTQSTSASPTKSSSTSTKSSSVSSTKSSSVSVSSTKSSSATSTKSSSTSLTKSSTVSSTQSSSPSSTQSSSLSSTQSSSALTQSSSPSSTKSSSALISASSTQSSSPTTKSSSASSTRSSSALTQSSSASVTQSSSTSSIQSSSTSITQSSSPSSTQSPTQSSSTSSTQSSSTSSTQSSSTSSTQSPSPPTQSSGTSSTQSPSPPTQSSGTSSTQFPSPPTQSSSTSLTQSSNASSIQPSPAIQTPTGPVHVATVGAFTWAGCYTEANGVRALSSNTLVNYQTMTVEICANFCASYPMFGVEYSGECYCGSSLNAGSVLTATTDCSMLCDGNQLEYCGAGNRLDVYTQNPVSSVSGTVSSTSTASGTTPTGPVHVSSVGRYNWIGCYTEATGQRALSSDAKVNYQTMTVEICAAYCSAYSYFGLEYGGECYCGNSLNAGSNPAATTDCSMLCDGNQFEYCGAGNRLDVYQVSGTSPTVTTSTSVGSTGTSSVATSSSSATSSSLPAGWQYGGCFVDNLHGRIMRNEQPDNQQLSVEKCVNTCAGLGYTVAGIEYGVQCFCDSEIINGGALAANQADCSIQCPGNTNEFCGNGNRMSVYYTGNLTILPVPTTQTSGIQSWTYKGCRTDNLQQGNLQVRTLPWQLILTTTNSATNCLLQCSKFGYNAAGMEYGDECYCGDIADVALGNSTIVDDSQCQTVCSGNATEICGDGNRLSYYEWTGTPLYTWHTPSGANAGAYQFLIGGLCVPLLVTAGVNGKIQFLEKYGTAPNMSSTGAYELDPSQINNFNQAWRAMHVKTDVFCSASLTLPDKVGRQINIGGWAEESVYGIRLYWPDGSPGVAGVNDWQENYNELALQTARWYPSAMIMTNGSILVVGGEVGSNSAPSPTLELLPATGGGLVYCDWLQRTDPLNLYPFLAVLPSGGIFVGYYNEARILDPVSFNTIKTLPNMPGNVNNPAAGRTYPLEGTAVILPQVAPYTAPLTVLICGGSTTGAGQASDNCVSTQPDSPNPVWAIERMPSKRVMSCICALPDGTYLILNGAHQGVAGFGLATDPNLQAVLYDPSLAVGSRMSIMASTIVARLYHSEAVLMQDGRVVVSGSDPQDGVHPEEYRVEVFMPPYLLAGATQPTLTVSNTDWSYGQQITVSISIPTGNVANVKFSLMGAVSSTHGNSMGQRTFFPAFTCASATSCTITAPPNANICPMGWFQLFLLDGPTPGYSTWVRIGGDPGQLGKWPNLPDFNVPGV